MTSDDLSQLSFSGNADEDAATFIRSIQKIAFALGRHRDQDWPADYAATCLDGIAMRWYCDLEDEQRLSWNGLRRALLQRFPPPLVPGSPAAAPPPESTTSHPQSRITAATASPHSSVEQPPSTPTAQSPDETRAIDSLAALTISAKSGRIRLIGAEDNSFVAYLPRVIIEQVSYPTPFSTDATDALVVDIPLEESPWRLRVRDSESSGPMYLGMMAPNGVATSHCLQMCSSYRATGSRDTMDLRIWSEVSSNDRKELVIHGMSVHYQVSKAGSAHLWLSPRGPPGDRWPNEMTLIFEPIDDIAPQANI
ncbi:hypothetical protein FRB94_013938 [Tulasnella sp. JGI-2019a]|nr:hypothetical protein FRB93_002365 [Tulasnella sp. JGI-2019a]KAG9007882.1 hypothetical protein FRB94_013938 [Tulasnella sp. JGI-2019a]